MQNIAVFTFYSLLRLQNNNKLFIKLILSLIKLTLIRIERSYLKYIETFSKCFV